MDIKIEAFKKTIDQTSHYFLNLSAPYNYLGEAFWVWMDKEEDIINIIDGVERTLKGEWSEPLPLEFGSETVGVLVHLENSYVSGHFVSDQDEKEFILPTEKILHLLNLWLHFLRFSK